MSESDNDESEEAEDEDELEATADLTATLKDDIIGNFHDITADDFKQLMKLYRDERASFKDAQGRERQRQQRSLWDMLEERRRQTEQDGQEVRDQTD